ncbi:MAG: response regulator [Pseudomonadota bacterium]
MSEETGTKIKILILDDDKIIADMFGDLISENGRTVDVCYDGLTALENIQKNLYDIIIVDLIMPKVGGLDILKYAKQINLDVIVIIITGYASLETAIMAIKEGAYDYITKPCKLDEIKIVVDNAVDKIRLNKENKELLTKLQDAYHELMDLKKGKGLDEKIAHINFFSSNMPSLHYLYNKNSPAQNGYVDQLQALSSLKDKGVLTESEFRTFKGHLLKMIGPNE